ncbi:hypothetical protein FBY33_0202 [Arthrobacter sp. SLBN-112]|jgi:hypothetical protein|uniref:hypothetical protein n=1 Tax=Arthrobacter sp. SLBN-112 TaxID=2768452 RepID=UPI00114D561F|nr:hypothetical protein [Arthrobacter sp. SLBN-112]TQJ38207.1 hypothetical protein FBY33_0202 [Arthrobacter sp. SLBN-112]
MTTRTMASLLRRAWLLAGTLAVIAGLLGMHVLTAGHASHGAASHAAPAGTTVVADSAVGGHASHAGHPAAAATTDAAALAPDTCGGSCPRARESAAPCVPTAPGSPVTVVPPQATLAVLPLRPAAGNPGPAYAYLPPSATPCDLSISRT